MFIWSEDKKTIVNTLALSKVLWRFRFSFHFIPKITWLFYELSRCIVWQVYSSYSNNTM